MTDTEKEIIARLDRIEKALALHLAAATYRQILEDDTEELTPHVSDT